MKKCFAITGPFVPTNEPMTLLSYKHLRSLDVFCRVAALRYTTDKSLSDKLVLDDKMKNFEVEWLGNYNDALFSIKNVNLCKALINVNRYIKKSVDLYKKDNYDFVYTSSFPAYTIRAGKKIKDANVKVKWIASFTDPIHNSPYKNDKRTFKEYSIIEKIAFLVYTHFYVNEKDEKIAFENADTLVFICEEQRDFMIQAYCSKFVQETQESLLKKSVIFPLNYADEWNDIIQVAVKKEDKSLVLAHFGRVYGLRDATPFIHAVHELINEDSSLKNNLFIKQFGEFRKRDIQLIKKLSLEKQFQIHTKVPYEECIKEMNKADVLLIFDTILSNDKIQPYLPSKVLEYSLIGKNVLTITSAKSPCCRLSKESGALCALNDKLDIKEKLKEVIQGKPSKLNYVYTNEEASIELRNRVSEY